LGRKGGREGENFKRREKAASVKELNKKEKTITN